MWQHADQRVQEWKQQGQEGLVLWDGSVWEKPESLKSEGLGPVQSSKAHRLTHIKPGYYTPPGRPICVPGLRLLQPLVGGTQQRAGSRTTGCHALVDLAGGMGQLGAR